MRGLKIFSGRANFPLSDRICQFLNLRPARISLSDFPDGEIACKIEEDVRGHDVFLIQPTCPPVNTNLMELLIMIDSCKRASAARITAVMPYFGYARQDRKDEGRLQPDDGRNRKFVVADHRGVAKSGNGLSLYRGGRRLTTLRRSRGGHPASR